MLIYREDAAISVKTLYKN